MSQKKVVPFAFNPPDGNVTDPTGTIPTAGYVDGVSVIPDGEFNAHWRLSNRLANFINERSKEFWVNGTTGSDTNVGSSAFPFKTLDVAVEAGAGYGNVTIYTKGAGDDYEFATDVDLTHCSLTIMPELSTDLNDIYFTSYLTTPTSVSRYNISLDNGTLTIICKDVYLNDVPGVGVTFGSGAKCIKSERGDNNINVACTHIYFSNGFGTGGWINNKFIDVSDEGRARIYISAGIVTNDYGRVFDVNRAFCDIILSDGSIDNSAFLKSQLTVTATKQQLYANMQLVGDDHTDDFKIALCGANMKASFSDGVAILADDSAATVKTALLSLIANAFGIASGDIDLTVTLGTYLATAYIDEITLDILIDGQELNIGLYCYHVTEDYRNRFFYQTKKSEVSTRNLRLSTYNFTI